MNASFSIDPFGDTTDARYAPGVLIAGRYRLVRKLGEGGMAEVWLAMHEALKQEVAVKFVTAPEPYGIVPEMLERFRFEAQVSARLGTHTRHIVGVHDAGQHDTGRPGGVPFLVMEYVRGPTLAHVLAVEGPVEPQRFAGLLDQIADALGAAHALGIVHRDLKPSNLMLADEPDGSTTVKLADFGIAKAMRKDIELDRPKETALGMRVGSPAYMSPEQVAGTDEIGIQSDLWALGVIAYEALTGRDCFQGHSQLQLFDAICTARFEPASSVRTALPRALDAWFTRALAATPAERFSSADEMAKSFRAATAMPAPRRARWLAVLAASGAVAVLAIVLASAVYKARAAVVPAASAPASVPGSEPDPPATAPTATEARVAPALSSAAPTADSAALLPVAASSIAPLPAQKQPAPVRSVVKPVTSTATSRPETPTKKKEDWSAKQ
jgi:eukaryotic-like serine/threonine-protein kinase